MDNDAPKYAEWIPSAGGYVANGKVVSKSPQYGEDGKIKLSIDPSTFNGMPTQSSMPSPKIQQTNTPWGNNGITTANVQGSGTDVNETMTKIGSLATTAQNTENAVDSVLSTPAARGPNSAQPILSLEDQALQTIQRAKAANDYQGMINGYIELGRARNEDYSDVIQDLTIQRQQKIERLDNNYLQRINTAKQSLDSALSKAELLKSKAELTKKDEDILAYIEAQEEYQRLSDQYNQAMQEQSDWRNMVGYEDAMRSKYEREKELVEEQYVPTYMQAIQDISSQLLQTIPSLLNFQYNPYTDTSLQIAQQYATSRVKEQMNATGMYNSSMTQNAIARAVAELVPVYEKMAKEEAMQNFQLLQQTANFLMNLEQTQFSLWKGQMDVKLAQNAERRAQIDQAIQNANVRGYYTNEEAALLGVEPGTESQEAKQRALEKQEQLEAEQRSLIQSQIIGEFNSGLRMSEYEEQKKVDEKYDLKMYEDQQRIAQKYEVDTYEKKKKIDQKYKESTSTVPTVKVTRTIENPDGTKTNITYDAYYDKDGVLRDAAGNPVDNGVSDSEIKKELKLAEESGDVRGYETVIRLAKNANTNDKTEVLSSLNKTILKQLDEIDLSSFNSEKTDEALGDLYVYTQGLDNANIADRILPVTDENTGETKNVSMLDYMIDEAYDHFYYKIKKDKDALRYVASKLSNPELAPDEYVSEVVAARFASNTPKLPKDTTLQDVLLLGATNPVLVPAYNAFNNASLLATGKSLSQNIQGG